MTRDEAMEASCRVELTNRHGLHARPATEFVRQANGFDCEIEVEARGVRVSGKSVIEMMTLGAEVGTPLVITARGKDAARAVETLEKLIKDRFGEKE